ncbi:hypothetical protein SSX86_000460 [Deinandra increscens subsp. villosa]|uniref:Nudix hydrolase domain-containing protein n=1 Tax=Deinandra increscens subsp. villosa TaxID=3103831 RepID=A0AAP0DXY6_9ASTR
MFSRASFVNGYKVTSSFIYGNRNIRKTRLRFITARFVLDLQVVVSQFYIKCGLMAQLITENGVENVQLLPAINDHYGGVVVELKEHMDPTIFLTRLKSSMSQWTLQGKKGVWIKLPIHLVNLVESAVKEGFHYHHAEPDYLMLVNWIPETKCTLPENASHRVGVGAIVLNDKREILVVQEKNGILRGTGIWKIPTGIVEEGEDISVGVNREVKEETGVRFNHMVYYCLKWQGRRSNGLGNIFYLIDTEFVEVLAFRQWHKAFFQKSDLFFVCMMRPLSFDIQIQELEIEAAQWMPLEEFAAQPSAQKESLMRYIYELCIAKVDKDYSGFSPQPVTSFFSGNHKTSYIYFNKRDLK